VSDVDRTPRAGAPATILLYTDTVAAVVTRVSASTIWFRRVETGEETTENQAEVNVGSPPVRRANGILDKPFGDEQRVARRETGKIHGSNQTTRLSVGHSVSRTDYRF
jgi:hypothetical protein